MLPRELFAAPSDSDQSKSDRCGRSDSQYSLIQSGIHKEAFSNYEGFFFIELSVNLYSS
jgi:hypothetical protein